MLNTLQRPVIHRLPQFYRFGVARFPLSQHFLYFFFGFGMVFAVLVVLNIHIADKLIGLDSFFYRIDTVAEELVCKHRFANVYAAVVDDVGFV